MKSIYSLFAASVLALSSLSLSAQEVATSEMTAKKNVLKLSATNLFFKNFDVQYERILNQKWSLAYAVRFQPLGNFPGQSTLERDVNTGNEVSDFDQEHFRTGSISLTPEVRYYFGKGFGHGLYLGAFTRYSRFRSDDFTLNFKQASGDILKLPLAGHFDTYSAGLVLGTQFSLSNRLTLDIFLGGHFGQASGNVDVSYSTLSTTDQQSLQNILDNIQLKHLSEKAVHATVGPNRTDISINGFWAGYRGGISLGFWF